MMELTEYDRETIEYLRAAGVSDALVQCVESSLRSAQATSGGRSDQ